MLQRKEKGIVGVFLNGATDEDIPIELKNYGNALVAWNSKKISDALDGQDIWEHDNSSNIIPRNIC